MIKAKIIHKCQKCDYETKYISHLNAHLNRKTPCDKNKKSGSQMDPNGSKKFNFGSKMDPNGSQIKFNESKNNLQCEYCFKIFSFKTNLTKHIRLNICKKKIKVKINENENENNDNLVFVIENEDEDENILSNSELTKTVLDLTLQLKKLKKVKEKTQPIIIKNNNNITNNNNNIQNNIVINTSSIKDAFQQMDSNVFWSGPDMVIKLIKEVLFRNKIECIDISRQVYKYIMNGKEVRDVKGYQIQEKISNQYKDQTLKIRDAEIIKYEDKPGYLPIIQQQADKHIKTATDNNYFSNKLVKNLGKTVNCNN
jgi:hypothetical protein